MVSRVALWLSTGLMTFRVLHRFSWQSTASERSDISYFPIDLRTKFETCKLALVAALVLSRFCKETSNGGRIYKWREIFINYVHHDNKKLSYRRETARQLHTSFSAHSLITEHRICY